MLTYDNISSSMSCHCFIVYFISDWEICAPINIFLFFLVFLVAELSCPFQWRR